MPHVHERIDFVAEVLVVHAGRVLLRRHDKIGRWIAPGGHVELDEDPTEAAVREVREEVGLEVALDEAGRPHGLNADGWRELVPPRFMNRHRVSETHEHVSLVYFARSATADVVPGDGSDRSDEWHWFTRAELDLPDYDVPEPVRHYARCALDELGPERVSR